MSPRLDWWDHASGPPRTRRKNCNLNNKFSTLRIFRHFPWRRGRDRASTPDNPEDRVACRMLHRGFASNPPAFFAHIPSEKYDLRIDIGQTPTQLPSLAHSFSIR